MSDGFEFNFRPVLGERGMVVTIRSGDQHTQVLILASPGGIAMLPLHGSAFIAVEQPAMAFVTTLDNGASQAVVNVANFLDSIRTLTHDELDPDFADAVQQFLNSQ
jgi:hypothetical protein